MLTPEVKEINRPPEFFMSMAVKRTFVGAAALAAAVVLGSAGSASAWYGDAHITVNTNTQWGGWVNGNGPDSYRAVGVCKDGSYKAGVTRWAGDRRGSFVTCSSGFNWKTFDLIPA
jgi:hypothetical protein